MVGARLLRVSRVQHVYDHVRGVDDLINLGVDSVRGGKRHARIVDLLYRGYRDLVVVGLEVLVGVVLAVLFRGLFDDLLRVERRQLRLVPLRLRTERLVEGLYLFDVQTLRLNVPDQGRG